MEKNILDRSLKPLEGTSIRENILVRVKRKRIADENCERDLPPRFIFLKTTEGNKRRKASLVESSFEALRISDHGVLIQKEKMQEARLVLCELLKSEEGETIEAFDQERMNQLLITSLRERGIKRAHKIESKIPSGSKRLKIVDLEDTLNGIRKSAKSTNMTMNGQVMQTENKSSDASLDYAIWFAFKEGIFDEMLRLIQNGEGHHDVNYRRVHGDGTTCLMAAAFHQNLLIVKELLKRGADVSVLDFNGNSALDFLDKSPIQADKAINEEIRRLLKVSKEETQNYTYDFYCVHANLLSEQENGDNTKLNVDSHQWGKENIVNSLFEPAELGILDELVYEQFQNNDTESEDHSDPDNENYRYNDYPDEESSENFEKDSSCEESQNEI